MTTSVAPTITKTILGTRPIQRQPQRSLRYAVGFDIPRFEIDIDKFPAISKSSIVRNLSIPISIEKDYMKFSPSSALDSSNRCATIRIAFHPQFAYQSLPSSRMILSNVPFKASHEICVRTSPSGPYSCLSAPTETKTNCRDGAALGIRRRVRRSTLK